MKREESVRTGLWLQPENIWLKSQSSEHFTLKHAEHYILAFGGFGVSMCFGGVFCKALVA